MALKLWPPEFLTLYKEAFLQLGVSGKLWRRSVDTRVVASDDHEELVLKYQASELATLPYFYIASAAHASTLYFHKSPVIQSQHEVWLRLWPSIAPG